jgi:hypothetical protein
MLVDVVGSASLVLSSRKWVVAVPSERSLLSSIEPHEVHVNCQFIEKRMKKKVLEMTPSSQQNYCSMR